LTLCSSEVYYTGLRRKIEVASRAIAGEGRRPGISFFLEEAMVD